jgi:hypothetical protein
MASADPPEVPDDDGGSVAAAAAPSVYAPPRAEASRFGPPRMPGDHGLPGLGLMIQFWSAFEALSLSIALVTLTLTLRTQAAFPWVQALIIVGTVVRAVAHYVVGMELTGGGLRTLARVRTFAIVAAVVTAAQLLVGFVGGGSPPWTFLLWTALQGVTWPVVLAALLHRPAMRSVFTRVADGEVELVDGNRSIEAVGIMMVVLGGTAVGFAGMALVGLLGDQSIAKQIVDDGAPYLGLAVAVFLARGAAHLGLGARALAGGDRARFARSADIYARVHWAALALLAVPAWIGVAKVFRADHGLWISGRPQFGLVTLALIIGLAALLCIWPLLLRSYAHKVSDDVALGGDPGGPTFARAPDGGLVTVGWFLLGYASSSLGTSVLSAVLGQPVRGGVGTYSPFWFVDADLPSWLGLAGLAVSAWAGVELVFLTRRARFAAATFAVAAIGSVVATRVGLVVEIWRGAVARSTFVAMDGVFEGASLFMSIVVPVTFLVIAFRRLPDASVGEGAAATRRG